MLYTLLSVNDIKNMIKVLTPKSRLKYELKYDM